MKNIAISADFRKNTIKAVLSIGLFILTYIALIAATIGLTIGCCYLGIGLVSLKASGITFMLALALASVGFLILFFLVKFIFSQKKTDWSHLTEIKRADEPRLFDLIQEVVNETGTHFPKKVYVSTEVNASVFYNSSFWSMFMPVKKNLHIGVGLMNSVTVDEFKGILAHEFGHFSQRSMKVGSYVHNVNHIIHNMLYDNESYESMISSWANISGYFSFATAIGVKIISGIQGILKQVYNVVNINYMALSREMEFHADEIAANVAGPQSLTTSLVRMGLAAHSYNNVLNFYGDKIKDNKKPSDIFPQMRHIMFFWAAEHKLEMINGLPNATLAGAARFNKSKISFSDQWSSHPSDKDRINRLESLGINIPDSDTSLASILLTDQKSLQERLTAKLFQNVPYNGETTEHTLVEFTEEYESAVSKNIFPKKFNNFFDDININAVDYENATVPESTEEQLFSRESVDAVYHSLGMKQDIETLNNIASGLYKIKSFDYDGERHTTASSANLLQKIEQEMIYSDKQIKDYTSKIFGFYYNIARSRGLTEEFTSRYRRYTTSFEKYDEDTAVLKEMYELTSFIHQTTPLDTIKIKMEKVYHKEREFRAQVNDILQSGSDSIDEETRELLTKYVDATDSYFYSDAYNDHAIGLLFGSMSAYNAILSQIIFNHKKNFIDFLASLTETNTVTEAL